MKQKVQQLLSRLDELEALLGQSHIFDDPKKYRALAQEHAYLRDLKAVWEEKERAHRQLIENQELLKGEKDPEFIEVLKEDITLQEEKIEELQTALEQLLIPPDLNDSRPTILELRAGTGGEEAALFVADCVRMYKLFSDRKGWKYEVLSSAPSDLGGFKEYILVITGPNAYRFLQYEAGTHRVQRVPETEAQGRVHTSAITIAALPEPDEAEELELDDKDLRIDTYRASGAGGQHVNVTDSAVRITHIPSGIVVYCQDERSQHKNKAKAMRHLRAKIAEIEQQKKHQALADTRALQVGSGDRSERIRTYNFSQNRITDHRINLTKYNLDQVMEGNLDEIVTSLVSHYYQEKLKASEPT